MAEHYDLVILGAGPAGLSAAANAAVQKLSYLLIEKAEIGNTIFEYQLRKHVMAEPTRLPLRAKVPFAAGTRESILEAWNKVVGDLKINVKKGEVTSIKKIEDKFHIKAGSVECTAVKVILAIGMQGSPRKLGVPGDGLPHVAYTLSDPDAFKGIAIAVVGAGDAAIENAIALSANNQVMLINRGAEFARAKEANVSLIQKAISTGKIKCFYDTTISEVSEGSIVLDTPDGDQTVKCDHIICRLGCIMPRKFLDSCGIAFTSEEPTAPPSVNEFYESSVPGLYVLGALIGYPLIKQAINQGYEVVQHLVGQPVPPADQVLIEEKLKNLEGDANKNLEMIRANLSLFAELSVPQFRELITESTVHTPDKGDVIFERNDYTDTFFSIISGSVEIVLPTGANVVINQGNFFGEMGLVSGRRRSATVKAGQSCIVLETPRKQMIKLISSVKSVKSAIDQHFVVRALATTIFPDASYETLYTLASQAQLQIFKKGQAVFKEGDPGDAIYVVRKGSVKISRRNAEGEDIVQTYLPAGSLFGEMAILQTENPFRSATVTAAVPCELLMLHRDHAHVFFEKNPKVKDKVEKMADARRVQNLLNAQNEDLSAMLDFMFKEGISDAENVLTINSDLCVSCDNCEAACAATHGGYSRLDRKGGKSFASIQIPISCRHCENPLCMLDCPPDALTRNPNGEVVIRDSCIGCGNCVRNCPYGVIQMVYEDNSSGFSLFDWFRAGKKEKGPAKAAKCDLCEGLTGGPACVRACPTGAAIRTNPSILLKQISKA